MTYHFYAIDEDGASVEEAGLTWNELCKRNGDLTTQGFALTAWKTGTAEQVSPIPPAWADMPEPTEVPS